jgi:teichuronic acid biosynthesis glycosyltransferase TuaH
MSVSNVLKNCDIIMVGQQPWDVEIGSNNKNIAYEFSKNNRVLYVNYALGRSSSIRYKKDDRVIKRLDIINHKTDGLTEIQPNLWVYYPDVIIESINWVPGPFLYSQFNRLNNSRFAKSILKAINRLDFKNYILFNDNDIFRPFYLKEMLKPKLSIYYSRDFLLTVDYWKQHGQDIEPKLIAKSDICVANSVYLADYCRKYNPNSYYIGQGCDIDEFVNFNGDMPADIAFLKKTQKPIIGYVGALQNIRLNIDLIKNIALNLPDYNFVLIGPEDDYFKKSDLHSISNIYFLGYKPVEMIPAYIKSFDVCINPQIINDVTIGNYPRKIDEYLAMGKPVIATKTLAMSVFKEHTYLCRNITEYISSIKSALSEDSPELQQQRIKFASDHTWENSVKKIYSAINKTIGIELSTENKPIFIFSNMRYNSPIEATSLFLARALAKKNRVYYIENPFTIRDYLRHKSSPEFLAIKKSFLNADDAVINTNQGNLKTVIPPIVSSINFLPEGVIFRFLLKINEQLIIKRLRHILKKESIKDFIFINSFNFHYPDVGKLLDSSLMIYHCIDPLITPYDLKHGFVSELELVEDSDAVVCTSKALYLEKLEINNHSYLLPNAADLSHSSKALDPELPVHPKLSNIPKPIIGYFGSIERRIDYDLMQKVVNANPDKSFVFAGPVINEHIPAWFKSTSNVYLTDQIPYNEMPQMIKGFDIATIPFKKDDVSATIFPLKLFEYLGAGKPVIVTNFNTDLKDYTKDAVIFCADAEQFSDAITNVLNTDNLEKLAKRREVANENTWEASAEHLMEIISKEFKLKYKK